MARFIDFPLLTFVLSFFLLLLSAHVGKFIRNRGHAPGKPIDQDLGFNFVVSATLSLLGLIIGFTFSMAISRYDLRKDYEEAEANAIGTEYLRADLLAHADKLKLRMLIKDYLDQRVLFYTSRDIAEIVQINNRTSQLQRDLWLAILIPTIEKPTAISALVVAGMNDVLNAQGYTQAGWWNRIPRAAWTLMFLIAICCNILIGYSAKYGKEGRHLLLVLPFVVSVSFFLIADIDSPRGGLIRLNPENLLSLGRSLQPQSLP